MSFERRIEWVLFFVAFVSYAWFNQGGGWNQNARFAEVRAIVDGGVLNIDDYFCYQRGVGDSLRRYPVRNGDVTIHGKVSRLSWVTQNGDLLPVNGVEAPTEMEEVGIDDLACSGDVSFAKGHFHPNKPPGLSLVAVPGYFLLSHVERWWHADLDDWWVLNVNAWLTSVFSVGVISAGAVVLAFRMALRFSGGALWPSFWSAVAFGFGTLYFPFATLLFDHSVDAALLVSAFYFLLPREQGQVGRAAMAGLLAGLAAITNYVAAVPAAMLGVYLLVTGWRREPWRQAGAFAAGMLGPFLAICAYNESCYGSPFALSNAFQNPAFIDKGPTFLGMFGVPDPAVAIILLVSPFRGIFYEAPVLLAGVYGLWRMRAQWRAEAWLMAGVAFTFYLVNMSFLGWHAGFSSGSRYLIPSMAFLVIPTVFGFMRWPRVSGGLLAASVGINALFTVTDVESPAGVGSLAMARDREMYLYSPLTEYAAPLFFEKRAWPILNLMIDDQLGEEEEKLTSVGMAPEAQKLVLEKLEGSLRQAILAGSDDPLELGAYTGPVSVNPTGVCEGGYFRLFEAGSRQEKWNSFNVGEFWFPESRLSLLPWLALVAAGGVAVARAGRTAAATVEADGVSMAEIEGLTEWD